MSTYLHRVPGSIPVKGSEKAPSPLLPAPQAQLGDFPEQPPTEAGELEGLARETALSHRFVCRPANHLYLCVLETMHLSVTRMFTVRKGPSGHALEPK